MSEYVVIYEGDDEGWSAYAPDLPGCVAAGRTRQEVEALMREAVPLHLAGLREEGVEVPPPRAVAGLVTGWA